MALPPCSAFFTFSFANAISLEILSSLFFFSSSIAFSTHSRHRAFSFLDSWLRLNDDTGIVRLHGPEHKWVSSVVEDIPPSLFLAIFLLASAASLSFRSASSTQSLHLNLCGLVDGAGFRYFSIACNYD